MAEGSDVNYWNLIFIGAMLLLVVIAFAMLRNRKSRVDPDVTERATRDNYEKEHRENERDPGSGL